MNLASALRLAQKNTWFSDQCGQKWGPPALGNLQLLRHNTSGKSAAFTKATRASQLSPYLLWARGTRGILAPGHHPPRRLGHKREALRLPLRAWEGRADQAQRCIQVCHGGLNLLEAPEPHLPHTLWTAYQGELQGFQRRTRQEQKESFLKG